jgi:hypothetical protein
MIAALEFIAQILSGVLKIGSWILRALYFIAGCQWLFSRKYREEVAKQPWYSRWLIYDGAAWVVLLFVVVALFTGALFIFR